MRIRLIRDDLGIPPGVKVDPEIIVIKGKNSRYYKKDSVIEVDAYGARLLVNNGDAEPADEEAETAAGNWRQKRQDVLLSREMLGKGIEPGDRERFRRGEILGYDADGNDIPGPNWVEPEEDEYENEESDE